MSTMKAMVWRIFEDLPPEAQQQVVDLIISLENKYVPETSKARKSTEQLALADEPFIGMWRDRGDLEDSSAWIRKIRESEWLGKSE